MVIAVVVSGKMVAIKGMIKAVVVSEEMAAIKECCITNCLIIVMQH
jgi:hypothetical protein